MHLSHVIYFCYRPIVIAYRYSGINRNNRRERRSLEDFAPSPFLFAHPSTYVFQNMDVVATICEGPL